MPRASQAGERKLQILQMLAGMLETPQGEKITTAALAARLDCSEAALYRHFASKAQMYDGLIDFIERSLFGIVNQVNSGETDGMRQLETTAGLLLRFAEKNKGMTRVLIGDALVNEHERLQTRINQLIDKLEASFRQALRVAATQGQVPPDSEFSAAANLLMSVIVGRWHAYAKSGFTTAPSTQWAAQWKLLSHSLRTTELTIR